MRTKTIVAVFTGLGMTAAFAGESMKVADTDADGLVTFAEFEAAHDARLAEDFSRLDKNADGVLTEDEMQRSRRGDRGKHRKGDNRGKMNPEKALERLDEDGSGSVSLNELQGKRFSPDTQAFSAADVDGNGELNVTELQAMMKARRDERRDAERNSDD